MNKNVQNGPLISVIMPVYNTAESYLREAVESILNQTYQNFEFLIIDDGSTDPQVGKTLRSFNDERIKLLQMPKNGGAAAARNMGLKHAQGEFIALFDSDDVSYKERFAKQVDFFLNHPEIGALGSACREIPANIIQFMPKGAENIKNYLLFKGCVLCQSSVMIRRKPVEENHFEYQSEYVPAEDYAFWLELSQYCQFENLDEVLIDYRWHGKNISSLQAEKQAANAIRARYCQICKRAEITKPDFANRLADFVRGKQLTAEELHMIEKLLPELINRLDQKGYNSKMFYQECYNFVKRNIKKCPDRKYLKLLLNSDLVKYFRIPLMFRTKIYLKKLISGV